VSSFESLSVPRTDRSAPSSRPDVVSLVIPSR
jgi:hypothetical protein